MSTANQYLSEALDAQELLAQMEESCVPAHLRGGLRRYFKDRMETGAFLRCVLENDLLGAIKRMNPPRFDELPHILDFLLAIAPAPSWGSKENVAAWLDRSGEG